MGTHAQSQVEGPPRGAPCWQSFARVQSSEQPGRYTWEKAIFGKTSPVSRTRLLEVACVSYSQGRPLEVPSPGEVGARPAGLYAAARLSRLGQFSAAFRSRTASGNG